MPLVSAQTREHSLPSGAYRKVILDPTSDDIRLLLISVRQVGPSSRNLEWEVSLSFCTASLKDPPRFVALSYAWGAQENTHKITVEGHAVVVRQNLYEALRRLIRLHTHDWGLISRIPLLWVDALCIDQNNLSERNHQVQLMSSIYSQASFVLIWLGEHADGSHSVVHSAKHLIGTQDVSVKEAMTKLLSRPYWTRLWVVQEVLLAQSITLLCGWDYVDMSVFARYLDLHLADEEVHLAKPDVFIPAEERLGGVSYYARQAFDYRLQDEDLEDRGHDEAKEQLKATPGLDLLRAKTWWHPKTARLHRSIIRWAHRQCEDPRDKVFALLGMIDNKDDPSYKTIIPDYALSREMLYVQVVLSTLEAEGNWLAAGMGALMTLDERKTFADDLMQVLGVNEYDADVENARKQWQSGIPDAMQAGRFDSTRTFRPSGLEVWKATYAAPKAPFPGKEVQVSNKEVKTTAAADNDDVEDLILGDLEL